MEIKNSKLLYERESYKVRGAFFNVYNSLGGGIKEEIIHRSLIRELSLLGLASENKKHIDINYKGKKVGVYIPDIIIEDKIIVEIKSKPFITKEDEKQFWGYLKGSKYQLGFLVGFTLKNLVIKRLIHTEKNISA